VQVREQYATAISKLDQLALAGKEPVTNSAGQTILFTVIYTIYFHPAPPYTLFPS
jgi:hypothetical protein